MSGRQSSYFDVYAWKGDSILLVETKWLGHNRIRKSQLRWLSAALDLGLSTDAFLVVEWSVEI